MVILNKRIFLFLFVVAFSLEAYGDEHAPKVLGSKECGECHTTEVKVWKKSKHFRTFRELHRRKKAKEIAKKLGIKRIRSEKLCQNCHYTVQAEKTRPKAIEGISCESCHGAAKDWLDIHSDYGSKTATRETESKKHRQKRLAKVHKAGLLTRNQMYEFASNCYDCHTTPEEKLVNIGGHPAGSKFELLSWLEGEVLHNVFYSNSQENLDLPIGRRRKLYIVGLALDVEYAFKGIAGATKKAKYAVEMARRAKKATTKLYQVSKKLPIPELTEMVSVFKQTKLSLKNKKGILRSAEKISAINKRFASKYSGKELSAVDEFLPKPSDAVGKRLGK